jgi:hypothetical protein
MHNNQRGFLHSVILCGLLSLAPTSKAQLIWTVGVDDNGWPAGDGGGPNTSFVQENGVTNPLPGDPASPEVDQQADNDYYFSGVYDTVIESNGDYSPIGVVIDNEEAAERALTPGKTELRYHFNLPADLQPTNLLSVTFDALNLDTSAANVDPRYGIEVLFNNVLVQPQILIRGAQLNKAYTSPQFSLEQVNAQAGPGFDNIVTLRGVPYNNDGGGNWMGIDYVQLNQEGQAVPQPVYPWAVGLDDDKWPVGDGGGTNATFVQENGVVNPLPGVPNSPEVDQQADNDYYFAGSYTTIITNNGDYTPVGIVAVNEEAAERAVTTGNTELRYHFNLPNTLKPSDLMAVTFDPLNLQGADATVTDPRFGAEVYFNGIRVMPEVVIRPAQLNKAITTPAFRVDSVAAQVGSGFDNIVTIKGISHSAEGGGDWMGLDYIQLNPVAQAPPPALLPWTVGINDNAWPTNLHGGGASAAFVQENAVVNPLPGTPNSPTENGQADNDYYLAGYYTSVVTGNGTYTPVGIVSVNEEAAERALTPGNSELRYHFNLPASLKPTDQLSVAFDVFNLDDTAADPHYGVEVYVNNVKVLPETAISPANVGVTINTQPFTLASANVQAGPGFDNIVTLKGISKDAEGGGNWMGIDYIQMNPVLPPPFPWSVGKDDNGQPAGNGGGPNTSFVQENGGSNPLPGNPNSPEVNGQADDDYYFAGDYSQTITNVTDIEGEYTPVGTVLVNEESAERAFAGSDNTKRYHFNLPSNLKPTDQLMITYDIFNLDTGAANADPQYGIEVYFNDFLLQSEIIIRPADIDFNFTTAPFTLESVGAKAGPGFDNIITLHGINHAGDGGGNWMGIDYVALDPLPTPVFPWQVGSDDGTHITSGSGGGTNTAFVQENGTINDLPGNAHSPQINQQADNDYYFAGIYTNTIPSVVAEYGDYVPVGIVPANEESAERAFAGADNDLRYHFNLPTTLQVTNRASITFEPLNLDQTLPDSQYGIEIYFNGVKVQDEIVIHTNDLNTAFTTAPFTLASVNAQLGLGSDNIVSLKGVNYNAEGGGNWMGLDYVRLNAADATNSAPKFLTSSVSNGKITLTWSGTGNLQSAPAVSGPWTPVAPAPASPYTENVQAAQNRFYRLVNP